MFQSNLKSVEGSPSECIDQLMENYTTLAQVQEAYPHWITPTVEIETPPNDTMGRWVRFKLKSLLYLKHRGKVQWNLL
jgi:hypothetical protein